MPVIFVNYLNKCEDFPTNRKVNKKKMSSDSMTIVTSSDFAKCYLKLIMNHALIVKLLKNTTGRSFFVKLSVP